MYLPPCHSVPSLCFLCFCVSVSLYLCLCLFFSLLQKIEPTTLLIISKCLVTEMFPLFHFYSEKICTKSAHCLLSLHFNPSKSSTYNSLAVASLVAEIAGLQFQVHCKPPFNMSLLFSVVIIPWVLYLTSHDNDEDKGFFSVFSIWNMITAMVKT